MGRCLPLQNKLLLFLKSSSMDRKSLKRPKSSPTSFFVESFELSPTNCESAPIWLTKDRSLMILGLNAKSRKSVSDIDGNEIRKCVREKLVEIESRRERLDKLLESRHQDINFESNPDPKYELARKKLENINTEKFIVESAGRLLLNRQRIGQLTSDMSWRPGIPKPASGESKWVSTLQPKTKGMLLINKLKFADMLPDKND